jgi:hypothetical protein
MMKEIGVQISALGADHVDKKQRVDDNKEEKKGKKKRISKMPDVAWIVRTSSYANIAIIILI